LVTEGKLVTFLSNYIIPQGHKTKKNPDGTPVSLGRESILSYVKAVCDLYSEQVSLPDERKNKHPHPRGAALRKLLDTLSRQEFRRKKNSYEDRGKHTLADGYTVHELISVSRYFMNANTCDGIRNKFDFLFGHSLLSRGENKRLIQLPDLFLLELMNEGPTPCFALVATMSQGKTNQHGRIEYGAVIRHYNVETCPISALALYFFARFEMEEEEFPDFTRRSDWYDIRVLKGGKSRTESISYNTQYKSYKKAFAAVGIHSSKVTHINRDSALMMID
jgi:hypothetical protein